MGNEPVYDGATIIGVTTSGAYGHCVEKCLAFAYVDSGFESPGTSIEISILGERRKAIVLDVAACDPSNKRLQS
jgi:dimethylglycine dehydrogenase